MGPSALVAANSALMQADGIMAKVFGWYDNEWGYPNRLVDVTQMLANGGVIMATKRWTVDIYLDEHPETRYTRAEARLHTGDPTDVRGVGISSRNPRDMEVPEIGDELAAARALADLAEKLRLAAAGDVEAFTTEASHGW